MPLTIAMQIECAQEPINVPSAAEESIICGASLSNVEWREETSVVVVKLSAPV